MKNKQIKKKEKEKRKHDNHQTDKQTKIKGKGKEGTSSERKSLAGNNWYQIFAGKVLRSRILIGRIELNECLLLTVSCERGTFDQHSFHFV